MKKILVMVMTLAIVSWSIPKPMESITNYNVMMIHGAMVLKTMMVSCKASNGFI